MLRYLTATLGAAFCAVVWTTSAFAGSEPFLGQVDQVGGNFCSRGWHPTDGTLLAIADNSALAQLLGTRFGGDGVTTFGLPNIQGNADASGHNFTSCIALNGIYPPH